MRKRWLARACVGALGGLGIAVAHWAAYLLAARDAHSHQHLLESTGHRYWPVAGALLVALLAGTLGVSLSTRFQRATSRLVSIRRIAAVLVFIQTVGFLMMEAGERLLFATGHPAASMLSEPVLWIGVALQIVVALGAAVLLRALLRVAALVRSLLRGPVATRTADAVVCLSLSQIQLPPLTPGTGGFSLRGPPALSLS